MAFGVASIAQPANDNALNAIDVTSLVNNPGCSADAAYTTVNATNDKNFGTCWNTTGGSNVWFWFTAPTDEVTVLVNSGGSQGTLRYSYVALWDSDTVSQLACERYIAQFSDLEMSFVGLTPGNRYFISVDNHNGSAAYRGTFQLCLDSVASYDHYERAVFVDTLMDACSPDAHYSTAYATADQSPGTCWNTVGGSNRWFAFVATTTSVTVEVLTGGSEGTLRYGYVAMYNSDLSTQIACERYTAIFSDLSMSAVGLTVGDTFYIQVDNHNGSVNYRGTFALCLSSTSDYDFYESAIFVDTLIDNCSPDAHYTTVQATADQTPGTCWNTAGGSNRWFAFVATSTSITVDVLTGGSQGTLRYAYVALYNSDLSTEIACERYTAQFSDLTMSAVGLTIGDTFYIQVDNHNGSVNYRGTFALCLSSTSDYDFYETPIYVDSLMNTCSPNASYTTSQATADQTPGTCWNTAGGSNRWFAFVATSSQITVQVLTGGSQGTLRYAYVALYNSDLSTEIACQRYTAQFSDLTMSAIGLTVGDTFYIQVDNHNGSTNYRGTFALCLSDQADYDFYEAAIFVDSLRNSCSPDAHYTTAQATADQSPGSCWNTTGGSNRWFAFVATTTQARIEILTGGSQGSLRYSYAALWNSDLSTQLACVRYTAQFSDIVMNAVALTPGDTFYISVDNHNGSLNYRGTFALCWYDSVDYDFQEGAHTLYDVVNWCSANGAFTTVQATDDKNSGSCWNTTGGSNRWFQFTATTAEINVEVLTGGSEGTIRYPYVALWDTDGLTQLACERYTAQFSDLDMDYTSLTPGNTYYISVDNHNGSMNYRGTFTLCVNDKVTYDFYERAEVFTDLNGWCSANGQYNTQLATPDKNPGSCWNTAGGSNRWFTFQAISPTVVINMNTGGAEGTIRYPYMALWDSTGLVELDCDRYTAQYSDLTISYTGLTVGHDYYITVDNHNGSTNYRGTFQMCITNVSDTLYSRGNGNWTNTATWSEVDHTGPAASKTPSFGDVVNIRHGVTLNSDVEVAEVNIDISSTSNGRLTLNDALLEVRGKFLMINTGNNRNAQIEIFGSSNLDILDTMRLQRDGANRIFQITLTNTAQLNVNRSLIFDINGGTAQGNVFTLDNSSMVNIVDDYVMDYSGGLKLTNRLNDTSQVTVGGDIYMTATGDDFIEIELNDSSQLFLGGNFVTGTPRYGILDCNDFSTLHFQSTLNLQTFPQNEGSGTGDDFTYQNVVINNSRVTRPQVEMDGPITIPGQITFIDGVIGSTTPNLLTLENTATITGQSTASYVEGPLKKIGSTDFLFPTGDEGVYAPIELTSMFGADAATEITSEYNFDQYSDVTSIGLGLNNVSYIEYWEVASTGNIDSTTMTLYWTSAARSDIDDFVDLRIVHYTGGIWVDLQQDSNVPGPSGSITTSGVTSFSPFTFGSGSPLVNFLPVEFLYVDAIPSSSAVEIIWGTASEIDNQYFEIERSEDLMEFNKIGELEGAGFQSAENHYSFRDLAPLRGTAFYRIKQVDYDGSFKYSEIVSVQFEASSKLVIYPNPVTDNRMLVKLGSVSGSGSIEIRDINGRIVSSLPAMPGIRDQEISLEGLNPGLYFVSYRDSNVELKGKFIKR